MKALCISVGLILHPLSANAVLEKSDAVARDETVLLDTLNVWLPHPPNFEESQVAEAIALFRQTFRPRKPAVTVAPSASTELILHRARYHAIDTTETTRGELLEFFTRHQREFSTAYEVARAFGSPGQGVSRNGLACGMALAAGAVTLAGGLTTSVLYNDAFGAWLGLLPTAALAGQFRVETWIDAHLARRRLRAAAPVFARLARVQADFAAMRYARPH